MDGTNIVPGDIFPVLKGLAGIAALPALPEALSLGGSRHGAGEHQLQAQAVGIDHGPGRREGIRSCLEQVQQVLDLGLHAGNVQRTALIGRNGQFKPVLPAPQRQNEVKFPQRSGHFIADLHVGNEGPGHQQPPTGADQNIRRQPLSLPGTGAQNNLRLRPPGVPAQQQPCHQRKKRQQNERRQQEGFLKEIEKDCQCGQQRQIRRAVSPHELTSPRQPGA